MQQLLVSSPQQNGTLAETLKLTPGPFVEITQGSKAEELSEIIARQTVENTASGLSSSASVMNAVASELGNLTMSMKNSTRTDDIRSQILLEEPSSNKKLAMIMVVGGISYLEISALRFLSSDPSFPYRFIISSTKIMNGKSFLSALEHVPE